MDSLSLAAVYLGRGRFFLAALMAELNSSYASAVEERVRRLIPKAFNLEEPKEINQFLEPTIRNILVPGTRARQAMTPRRGSELDFRVSGRARAVAIGAYAFALRKIDRQGSRAFASADSAARRPYQLQAAE